ncbi:MAG: glycosyltransferase family 4 protein [bacterium]|nr:MAG: glycosyltransferase family 4 protein [bacterium]
MNIGVDATRITKKFITGVERYVFNMVNGLKLIDNLDHTFFFFVRKENENLLLNHRSDNIKIIPIVSRFFLDWYIYKYKVEVMHYTFIPPSVFPKRCSIVYTFHDVGRYFYPEMMSWGVKLYHNPLIKYNLKNISRIITVSQSAQRDIIKCLNFPHKKIDVIYNALPYELETNHCSKSSSSVLHKFGIVKQYLLSVGVYIPTKNITILLKAFNKLIESEKNIDLQLILVGRKGWYKEYLKYISGANIILTGHVSDQELACLYKNAIVFIFPSLYEGFGMPLVEAMHFKTPIICSSIPVHHEVCNDAALYFNSHDHLSLYHKIRELLNNEELKHTLIKKGYNRSNLFSLEEFGKGLIECYEKAKGV